MHKKLCPYTRDSLKLYLLFPLIKLTQWGPYSVWDLRSPTPLKWALAIGIPILVPAVILKILRKKSSYFTLVNHSPKPDHPHSISTTIGVWVRSAALGFLLTVGISFIESQRQPHFLLIGIYMVLLSFFHFSEYFVTSLTNPSTLSHESFLIGQSHAYLMAISSSFVEYNLEANLFPELKKFRLIAFVGLMMAIVGEIIRKLAMFTAGRNFSHTISSTKSPDHKLVTHGIYGLFRHPSYAGWFYWAIGTQMLLQNPICLVVFSLVSYGFFKSRIVYEEAILVEFFGKDYEDYRSKVNLWMPMGESIVCQIFSRLRHQLN